MTISKLAVYLADYVNEEFARDKEISTETIINAIDAFEGGAYDGKPKQLTTNERNRNIPDSKFTVSMHPTLVDGLDEGFSPMDGLVAIDQMFGELPLLHQALAPKRLRRRPGHKLKVYRGCYYWYKSLGFSYVQIGTTLHVLELWYEENPTPEEMDVVLGKPGGYEPLQAIT